MTCPKCDVLRRELINEQQRFIALHKKIALSWSSTPPTQPGWYWLKTEYWERDVVYVKQRPLDGKWFIVQYESDDEFVISVDEVVKMKGQWAGPLSMPEE